MAMLREQSSSEVTLIASTAASISVLKNTHSGYSSDELANIAAEAAVRAALDVIRQQSGNSTIHAAASASSVMVKINTATTEHGHAVLYSSRPPLAVSHTLMSSPIRDAIYYQWAVMSWRLLCI